MEETNKSHVEISVIVPVYNAGKFLDRCISSLVTQQTRWTYELLFIDDGSTDGSLNLLREWKQRDCHIRLYYQSNQGVSVARNHLLQVAKGRYAVFVDADDMVDDSYLENMRNKVVETQSGLVITGCFREKPQGVVRDAEAPRLFSREEFHSMIRDRQMHRLGFPWGKMFDMQVIKEEHLEFEENVSYGEDLIFLFSYLRYADYVRFIDYCGYYYNMTRTDSLAVGYSAYGYELKGYQQLRNTVEAVKEILRISDDEMMPTYGRLLYFLLRAVKSMYRPVHRMKRIERLWHLENDFSYVDNSFADAHKNLCQGLDNFVCRLFAHQRYYFMDILLSVFFKARYSCLGKIYNRRKK